MLERWRVEVTFPVWSPGFSQVFQLPPPLSLAPLDSRLRGNPHSWILELDWTLGPPFSTLDPLSFLEPGVLFPGDGARHRGWERLEAG